MTKKGHSQMKNRIIFIFIILLFISLQLSWAEQPLSEGKSSIELEYQQAQERIRHLEKRVSDLELIINRLVEDKKLTEELDKEERKVVEEKKSEAPPAADEEWAAPAVIEEKATGRDEDARRRITELETWRMKLEAKAAKEEEEAVEEVKFDFSGKYKLHLNIRNNLNLDNPQQFWTYDNTTYFDQRLQLKIDAVYGPFTAVLLLDKGNFVFDWKEDSEGTLDRWSEFHTVSSALFRELYAQYTSDFIVKIGRQTFFVGNGGIVLEGPVDAIKFTYPFGQTPIGRISTTLAYIAIAGGYKDYTDFRKMGPPAGDRSAIFSIANKLDGWLFSFNIKPSKNLTIEPYVLKVFDRGEFGDPDLNLDKDFNMNTTPRDGGFEPLWIGAAISGRKNRVSYEADLIYLTDSYTLARDINAYAILLRGDYDFKTFSLGLELGRSSGNKADDPATEDMKYFSGLFLCKDRRKIGNLFSEDIRAGYFLWDSNLSNITFVRLITDFEPIKKLNTNISLAKLWTAEDVYKGRGPVSNWWDWSDGASITTEKTKDIGWEIDLNLNFPIYKRLRGFAEFGYFIPGAVYQQTDGQNAHAATEIVVGTELEF
jgi:hypothetical protein